MESKLFKKLFSMLIVVAMVLSMCPTFVFAEGTETLPEGTCPTCKVPHEWVTFDMATHVDENRVIAPGYYKLAEDIQLTATLVNTGKTSTDNTIVESESDLKIAEGTTVCIDMAGHDITVVGGKEPYTKKISGSNIYHCACSRALTNNGTLTLLDSVGDSTISGGVVSVAAAETGGGGNIYNGAGATLTVYDITISGGKAYGVSSTAKIYGGNVFNAGTFKMYNGTISDGRSRGITAYQCNTYGGNVGNTDGSTFYMSGGTLSSGHIYRTLLSTEIVSGGGNVSGHNADIDLINVAVTDGYYYENYTSTSVSGNRRIYSAGANIFVKGGTLDMTNTTVSDGMIGGTGKTVKVTASAASGTVDAVSYARGGNIYAYGATVNMTGGSVTGGVIHPNPILKNAAVTGTAKVEGIGGNIYIYGGTMNITDTVITGGSVSGTVSDGGETAGVIDGYGGNIYAYGATVNMTGGTISGGTVANIADISNNSRGGDLYLAGSGTYTLTDTTIIGGTAKEGGSIYGGAGTITINGTSKVQNGTADTQGGNIYLSGSTVTIGGSTEISGGTATGGDGGNVYLSSSAKVTIADDVQIFGGTAGHGGGNIFANSKAKLYITGGTVKDGVAQYADETVWGGGNLMAFNGSSVTISGGTISGGTGERYSNSILIRDSATLDYFGGTLLATNANNELPLVLFEKPSADQNVTVYNGTWVEDPSAYLAPCACYEMGANGEYKVWHVGTTAELTSCTTDNCAYKANTLTVDPDNTPAVADKHEYDNTGYCTICGVQAMVRVDWTDGTSTHYPTMVSALLAADDTGATVHVLRNTSEKWIYYKTDENGDYIRDKDGEKIPVPYFPQSNPISNITISSEPGVKIVDTSVNSPEKVYYRDVVFEKGVDFKMSGFAYMYGTVDIYGTAFFNSITEYGTLNIHGDQGATLTTNRNTWICSNATINVYGKGDGALVWNSNIHETSTNKYSLTIEKNAKLYVKDAYVSFAGVDLSEDGNATVELDKSRLVVRFEGSSFTSTYSMTIHGGGNVLLNNESSLELVGSVDIANDGKITLSVDSTFKTTTDGLKNSKIVAAEGVNGCVWYNAETGVYSAKAHDADDATCTADGKCTNCNAVVNEATGHTDPLTKYDAEDATCTEAGHKAYYYCAKCGVYFEDTAGKTVIADLTAWLAGDGKIGATGNHNYSEPTFQWGTDFTCKATYGCSTCTGTWTVDCEVTNDGVTASCVEERVKTHTAKVTVGGNEYTNKKTETLAKLDHSYDGTSTCVNGCSKTRCENEGHNMTTYVPAYSGSCIQEGYVEHWICGICNGYFADEDGKQPLDKLSTGFRDHTFEEKWTWDDTHHWHECVNHADHDSEHIEHSYTYNSETGVGTCECGATKDCVHSETSQITKIPTCNETGEETFTCSICGKSRIEELPVDKDNHANLKQEAAQAPTCDAIGWEAYEHCSACGYSTKEAIAANGHSYIYTSNGDKTHTVTCKNCTYTDSYEECTDENADNACDKCKATLANYVAEVNGTKYESLQEAIEAAKNGGTVKLLSDIDLASGIVIAKDWNVTIDLAGKTISYEDASGAAAQAIKNEGNLTIDDNIGGGKITFKSTTPSSTNSYSTSTIINAGSLTIDGGMIENTTASGPSYAIDNSWYTQDVSLTVNDGTITAAKIAVRQVPFSTTYKNVVNIKGGTLTGATAGLQVHNYAASATLSQVNIEGGTFNGTYAFYTSFSNAVNSGNTEINVEGGTFNGYLFLYNGNAGSAAEENVFKATVSGGTFNSEVYIYAMDAEGGYAYQPAISGGEFATEVYQVMCAEGYIPAYDEETGKYGVEAHTHNYSEDYHEATFEADAYTVYTCSACGDSYTETHEGTKKTAVAEVNGEKFETVLAAVAYAIENDASEVKVLCNVSEELSAIKNVTFATDVAGGVTITNTATGWIDLVNVAVGSGVTLNVGSAYFTDAGVNTIEGTLSVGTLYNANDSKITVQNGGKIVTTGMIVNRYHTAEDAGIYVYGDGNVETVEISCADTIGTYSGTFYAKDAVVEGNMLWIDYKKNSTEESDSYSQSKPVFENSVLNITEELRLYKDATLTLTGSTVTAGTVQVRENATPVVSVDSNSVIKADDILNLAGATLNAAKDENGNISFFVPVASVNGENYGSLADAFAAALAGATVTLLDDIKLTDTLIIDKAGEITIDGNSHIITLDPSFANTNAWGAAIMIGNSKNGDADTANHTVNIKNVIFSGITGNSVLRVQGVTLNMTDCTVTDCDSSNTDQGMLRIDATVATLTGCEFVGNTAAKVIGHNHNSSSSASAMTIENCVFEENTINGAGVVVLSSDAGCTIRNSTFEANKVTCSNGATVYMGFSENNVIVGNLFKDNTVTGNASNGRVAGALFVGYTNEISENAFVNNTATNASGVAANDICIDTIYALPAYGYDLDIDISENYFDGEKPAEGDNYVVRNKVSGAYAVDSYYATYENGTLGNLVEINYVAEVNGTKYESLLEAWQHATANSTIKLLADVDMTGVEGMYVPSSTLTLDLNGKTLKVPYQAIAFAGNGFTIKNGTIDSLGASYGLWIGGFAEAAAASNVTIENVTVIGGINIKNATNVTLNNVTATGIGYYAVWVEFNATGVVINSGSYTGAEGKAAVSAANADALTVKGGTYSSNVTAFCEEGKHTAPEGGVYVYGDHSYTSVYTPATNTENAYTTYTCVCGDSYVEVEEGTVLHNAVNVQTGESYATLQAALNAAAKGETVKLLKDTAEEEVFVGSGKTLDLNGKKLTVETISAAFTATHIIDSSNGKGLLVLDGEETAYAFNEHNCQLPLWTNEGVRFVSVTFQQDLDFKDKTGAANENVGYFWFYFKELAADTILDEFLANGTTGTGITVRIKVSYVTANDMAATQYFAFTDEMVKEYVTGKNGWDKSIFYLYLTGVAGLENLTFAAEIVSEAQDGSTVVIGSSPIAD